jgi:hypothetical protein
MYLYLPDTPRVCVYVYIYIYIYIHIYIYSFPRCWCSSKQSLLLLSTTTTVSGNVSLLDKSLLHKQTLMKVGMCAVEQDIMMKIGVRACVCACVRVCVSGFGECRTSIAVSAGNCAARQLVPKHCVLRVHLMRKLFHVLVPLKQKLRQYYAYSFLYCAQCAIVNCLKVV